MPLCLKNQFITSWFFVAATPFVLPVIYATLSLYPTVKHSVEFFRVSMNIKIFPPIPLPVLSWSSLSPLPVLSFGLDFSVLDLHTSNQRNWDRCLHFLFCKTAIFLLSEKIDQAKHQVLMPTPGLLPVLSHSAPSPLLVLSRSSSPSPLPVLSQSQSLSFSAFQKSTLSMSIEEEKMRYLLLHHTELFLIWIKYFW